MTLDGVGTRPGGEPTRRAGSREAVQADRGHWRREVGRRALGTLVLSTRWVAARWLLSANVAAVLILVGAVMAPALRAAGADGPAWLIYTYYRLLCLQRPSHSYILFGYQLALEQRMLAMFGAQLMGGLIYGLVRRPVPGLGWRVVAVLSLPMAGDIASQMVGLRDSDWLTRTWTGALAALAFVLWLYPFLDRDLRVPSAPRKGADV